MPVDRTEVAVAIDEGIAQREILCHTDHRVVYRGIAVRMVPPQHGAHGIRTLAVGFIGGKPVFVHGIEDPPVDGLQSVPDIRQGPGYDDRHRIFQKAFFHFLFQVDRNQLGIGGVGLFLQR